MKANEFLGDLENTVIINKLMETPFHERTEIWRDNFLASIATCNLKLAKNEVVMSDDGFPYIQLQTVQTEEKFRSYAIIHQLDTLLNQGFGIVINPQNDKPDWVFSYGDLVNLKLNGEFYTYKSVFSNINEYSSIGKDEEILVGQPSETIFPSYLRHQIRDFLHYSGLRNAKIMLIARNYTDEEKASQDLVFNIMPTQFATEHEFNTIMNTLQWMLPKHYSFFGVDELSIENGFQLI
ncbi:hypothetical protein ORI89_07700 [Sphingobacterium sp. UT-1RO-CII-1]|uniref:hypothetical protein n=1 Tax=Sphingobacterium sp. UT-1RO-CII-1 TaxID=2995225 RepID=UPI00227A891B|nr:hypothetical protein [Sphingobacterium sp. UT-1RO-CII-1]MCY4779530.1 hypothetical protein [Sphingobacterium sp. UT-1RO-CII-1]